MLAKMVNAPRFKNSKAWGFRVWCFAKGDLAEMCSGSETGSYSRLIDFVYHSTLGLRVIKKKKV